MAGGQGVIRAADDRALARAVERLRMEAARQLLVETGMLLKRVAQRCGFGTAKTMRRSFLRVQEVGPLDHRALLGLDQQSDQTDSAMAEGWNVSRAAKSPSRTFTSQRASASSARPMAMRSNSFRCSRR